MTKPPDDIIYLTVRDEDGDIRQRVRQGARRKRQKVADFLFDAIHTALEDAEISFAGTSDRKIAHNDRCQSEHHDS